MGQARVKLKYQGRVVVGDPTKDPWQIWDLDEETEQELPEEEKSEHEITWRVLLDAPDLEDLPVVLTTRADAHFLETSKEIPASLSSELDKACAGDPLLSPETPEGELSQVEEQDPDEVKENQRLIEQYLALAKEDPPLEVNSVELFSRAIERKLLGSLVLFDDGRAYGDPLPVSNNYPNWNLAQYKSAGWVARSVIQAGISTLYEKPYPFIYPPPQQGRRLILSGSTTERTGLTRYIPRDLASASGAAPDPFAPPFVVRAAETK